MRNLAHSLQSRCARSWLTAVCSEVKDERSGQTVVRAGDSNPHGLPTGTFTHAVSWPCSLRFYRPFELGGRRCVIRSCTHSSRVSRRVP
jgi:hypothetical protein